MLLVAKGLVVFGAIILALSIYPAVILTRELPASPLRRFWRGLTVLIALFIAGYIGYLALPDAEMVIQPLIVPVVFFFGACFVLVVCVLAINTVRDVRRLGVLERECVTDALTGLNNRRYFDARIKEEIARASRSSVPLSILMIDIDRFKSINDSRGHAAGDEVLRRLGELIAGVIRASDIAARYGGEEFVVIAPDTPGSEAATLAERLRRATENASLLPSPGATGAGQGKVTVSVGVASLGGAHGDAQSLLKGADEALYRAKGEGRNRVCATA